MGVAVMERRQYDLAAQAFRLALQLHAGNADALFNLGLLHMAQLRFADAVSVLRQCVALPQAQQRQGLAYDCLGVALERVGRPCDAVEVLERACRIVPSSRPFRFHLASALLSAGRLPGALALYEALHADERTDAAPMVGICAVRTAMRDSDAAVKWGARAVAISGANADAHFKLGVALALGGRHDEALEHYRQCLERDPDHALAANNMGAILALRGDYTGAIACYRRCNVIEPRFATAYCNLGTALAAQHRDVDAVAAFERCIELDPSHVDSFYQWGLLLLRSGQPEGALRCFRICDNLQPGNADFLVQIARAHESLSDLNAAKAAFQMAIEVEPTNIEAVSGLGLLLWRMKELDEARHIFAECIKLDPTHRASKWFLEQNETRALVDMPRDVNTTASRTGNGALVLDK